MRTQVDSVIELAHKMGIKSDIPSVPAIALGAVDLSLYEMVNVYGTLANKGLRPEPQFVTRIEDSEGNVILEFEQKKPEEWEQVLSSENAAMMTDMLEGVVDSGTARRLRYKYHLENDIAGKTGTTQNQSDGWFMGFTPNLVAGAWVGAESPIIRFRSLALGSGSNMALPIWGRFMNKVYKNKAFANQRLASFDPMPDSLLWQMDCPPFLEEMPPEVFADESMLEEDIEDAIESVINIFKKKEKKRVNTSPNQSTRTTTTTTTTRTNSSSKRKQSEEIRKQNERIRKQKERKKKRKKILDKIFKN